MKCKIPEISWHNRDPVLSVDIQPKCVGAGNNLTSVYRLASGGTDSHVLIWYMTLAADGSDIDLELASDLSRHQRAVNAVKWSPNGELLASGDDESVVFIWKQKADSEPLNIMDSANDQDKEVWITLKVLRGHMEDVYDLSWAPNSQFLVSGSVDNSAMIWDVHKGKSLAILSDHKGFVQGVAWDPKNQYIATLSTDRYLRIFDIQTKRVLHRINKGTLPVPKGHDLHGRRMRLFHDDTLQTFFRRLSFTPDGKLLLTPAGVTDYEGATRPLHTTYVFSRHNLRQPSIVLPCPDQYTVAVRCCPLLFRLRPHNVETNPPVVPLPYRMIFVVATRSSVYFYDTQQQQPFALISNIHYTRLTDVTWSSDGRIVVVSSTDGFCSLITFECGELGEEYEESAAVLNAEVPAVAIKKPKKQKENDIHKMRKSSMDESVKAVSGVTAREREVLAKVAEVIADDKSINQKAATPIAIKRKIVTTVPTPNSEKAHVEKSDTSINNIAEVASIPAIAVKPALPTDIIIDKEILGSEEKFESPEKKSRPATPISIRRHPRTPNNCNNTPTSSAAVSTTQKIATDVNHSPLTSLKQLNLPRHPKRATPIAVRRAPRALIVAPSAVVEEAMDAWPLDEEPMSQPANTTIKPLSSASDSNKAPPTKEYTISACEVTSDRTEDIRLVYEDTVDEAPPPSTTTKIVEAKDELEDNLKAVTNVVTVSTPKQNEQTPNSKTPRRVALKTISTPKSKKKLLE